MVAVGGQDVWAVGHQAVWDVWQTRAVIAHWNGQSWTSVPIRNDAIGADHLRAVAAASREELWAIGEGHDRQPYIVHGDGATWDRVNVPGLLDGSWLAGVDAVPGRVFTVGTRDGETLIAGYDGREWTFSPKKTPGALYGVTLTGRDHAWAVGDTGAEPLIMRWNGTKWKTVDAPDVPGGFLRDVYAEGEKRAWAIGGVYEGGRIRPLVLRWDGKRWSKVTIPTARAELYSLTGDGDGHLWISGFDPDRPETAYFLRFDGKKWKAVHTSPAPSGSLVRVQSVSQVPGHDAAWAVGHSVDPADRYTDLVTRFTPPA
ncbi:hypothetical protein D5H75_20445 [Bailinhaonella thermotolerans]|uniref:Photosynthesis system II assembly factor Ycf48/Hcf136-like domain-containing protein n=1 Tax=Bailinhaonella thermotolerans TaxID=1070861 RepID=A0A3A4AP13_9ACTN|nr:hypothetical protein D5H75_20445 [Bailinhaonella thermotolerans]